MMMMQCALQSTSRIGFPKVQVIHCKSQHKRGFTNLRQIH